MNRVLVMIPSRDRPRQLDDAVKSVLSTSEADVAVYIDDDQEQIYGTADHPRVKQVFGPRVGAAACCNALVEQFPNHAAYGLVTDDSVITTPGWDQWLLRRIEQYEDSILVVSPAHNHGLHVDMPFVTKEWIRAVGWFSLPRTVHFCWHSAIMIMGLATGRLLRARKDEFYVQHEQLRSERGPLFYTDSAELYNFMVGGFEEAVMRLKSAMKGSETGSA